MPARAKASLRSNLWSCSSLAAGSKQVMKAKHEVPDPDDLEDDSEKQIAEEIKVPTWSKFF